MKRNILSLTLALAAIAISGASIQASAQAPAGVQAIDLGLPSGIRWASCNVGATAPEDYGNYYAWGETETKADYSWATYKHNNGDNSSDNITKYGNNADTLTTLEPEDDAATANWGSAWRMPTAAELDELLEHCTWTWTTQNGVNGYQVASTTNGNSIFLPAAGYYFRATLNGNNSSCCYLSASLYEKNPTRAWYLYNKYAGTKMNRDYCYRNYGQSVRPVQDKQEEEEAESAYVPKPFTVADGKQITFSGGNLQYTQSTQTWTFAEHQYDIIGTDNTKGRTEEFDATYGYKRDGTALSDTIDLFGWSGSTGSAKWGVGTSIDNADYSGDFVDWGTNIDDGNTWYTLTYDEWYYLRWNRTDASNLTGVARINLNADGTKYVNGLVLLPDGCTCPAGVTFKSGFASEWNVQAYADYQTFTLADWQLLEASGAVFLPAAGNRYAMKVSFVQNSGYYWSATPYGTERAAYMEFRSDYAKPQYLYVRNGFSVRLVKNYSNVSTDAASPSAIDTAPARKILRNGQVLIERGGKTYTLTGVEVK